MNDLVNWQEKMLAEATAVASSERPAISTISLRSGIIQYMGEPMPDNKLNCIVLASMHENVFYTGAFDPDNPQPPACWAFGESAEGMAPKCDNPINATCKGCPNNEWGSDTRGGRGKACKEIRRLAVIPASGNITDNEMAMLKVPVTSVRNWANYVNSVVALYKRPPWGIHTTISTKPDPKSQFKVTFTTGDLLEDDALAKVAGRIDQAKAMLSTPYDTSPATEGAPKRSRKY
jgi:hypothetical protein